MACDPGASRCDGNMLQGCSGVSWINLQECPIGCDSSTNMCKLPDGAECAITLCKDATTLSKCNADFTITEEKCGANEECVINKCEAKSDTSECTAGEVKCSDDKKGTQKCTADGVWGAVELCNDNYVCDASKQCVDPNEARDCENDARECAGSDGYRVCVNNKWSDAYTCGENKVCEGAGECVDDIPVVTPDCTDGDVKCSDDNKGTVACADGKWGEITLCNENELCDVEKKSCVAAGEAKVCVAGEKSCADDKMIKDCNESGQWNEAAACPAEAPVCRDNNCVPAGDPSADKCNVGDKKCSDDGAKQLVCKKDGEAAADWAEVVCASVGEGYVCDATNECVAPASVVVCNKGDIKCQSNNSYVTCLDDGTGWDDKVQKCDNQTPVCDDDVKACVERCKNGDKRCSSDGVPQRCGNNGEWRDANIKCSDNEKCQDGDCLCIEGATKCGNGKQSTWISTCQKDGSWSGARQCGNNQVCDDNVCVDPCKDGATKCTDNGELATCTNLIWNEVSCGPESKCVMDDKNQSASCVCNDGAVRCANGGVQTCDNGAWKDTARCQYGCDEATGACNECDRDGLMNCTKDGVFQLCKDKKWVDVEKCSNAASCSVTRTPGCCMLDSAPVCSADNKSIMACVQKKSEIAGVVYYGREVSQTCSDGECKSDNTKTPYCSCKDGSAPKCDENSLMKCSNGKWVVDANCSEKNLICNAEKNACVCVEGSYSCNNNGGRLICEGGNWSNAKTQCSKSEVCSIENGGVCMKSVCDGNSYCKDATTMVVCNNGEYVEKACENKQSCSERTNIMGSTTASCVNNVDNRCFVNGNRCSVDGSSIEACKNGVWTKSADCAKSQVCQEKGTTAACVNKVCNEYEYSCNGDKIQFCSNNALSDVADCSGAGLTCKDGKCVAK